MIRRINEHQKLNGVVFTVVEFLLVAAAACLIALGFWQQGNVLVAILAIGTLVNASLVVGFGIAAWRRGERGERLTRVFSRSGRAEIAAGHPHLGRDTILLTVAALVPFLLGGWVLVERGTSSVHSGHL